VEPEILATLGILETQEIWDLVDLVVKAAEHSELRLCRLQ
jgi:hypothetical protein